MNINWKNIKRYFIAFAWLLIGAGCITLLVSASRHKDAEKCRGVSITISGVNSNFFIDKTDVYDIIRNYGGDSTGKRSLRDIDLKKIEHALEAAVWIKTAELFFDNNDYLEVFVEEREPIARIFTVGGNSFYTDSSCALLPLSDKFTANLPVFTDFPSEGKTLTEADSNLLRQINVLGMKIEADSFLTAMIDQVDITPARSFEMIPKLGKQLIVFGDASDADAKFSKLELFYKKVITRTGWNRYKTISLQYKDEVVGVLRGKDDVKTDSLETLSLLKNIADDASRKASDSVQSFLQDNDRNTVDSASVQKSTQRDEGEVVDSRVLMPFATPAAVAPELPHQKKIAVKQKIKNIVTGVKVPTIIKPKPPAKKPPPQKPPLQKPLPQKPKPKTPAHAENDY